MSHNMSLKMVSIIINTFWNKSSHSDLQVFLNFWPIFVWVLLLFWRIIAICKKSQNWRQTWCRRFYKFVNPCVKVYCRLYCWSKECQFYSPFPRNIPKTTEKSWIILTLLNIYSKKLQNVTIWKLANQKGNFFQNMLIDCHFFLGLQWNL